MSCLKELCQHQQTGQRMLSRRQALDGGIA